MLIVFAGKGEPLPHAEGFVASVADGIVVAPAGGTTLPKDGGLEAPCRTARFETFVMAHRGRTFEAGRVTFPEIDSHLDVYTPEPGAVSSPAEGLETGSISWFVRDGGGLFAGAKGIVTGNFTGRPDGTFVDHQLYKLLLPAE